MTYVDLTEEDKGVLAQAIEASNRLYVKDIQEVGAALCTSGGEVFSGIHFETATGFATICGEVAAISCMVAAGHRDVAVIAAVWRNQQGQHFLLPPCGRCREVISDFNPDAWVILSGMQNHWHEAAIDLPKKVRVGDLLPLKSHILNTHHDAENEG